jgi:hypothetical protein
MPRIPALTQRIIPALTQRHHLARGAKQTLGPRAGRWREEAHG